MSYLECKLRFVVINSQIFIVLINKQNWKQKKKKKDVLFVPELKIFIHF